MQNSQAGEVRLFNPLRESDFSPGDGFWMKADAGAVLGALGALVSPIHGCCAFHTVLLSVVVQLRMCEV